MKLFILMLLLVTTSIFSQTWKIGGGANVAVGGSNISYLFGPSLKVQYDLKNVPIALQSSTSFYLGDISELNISSYTNFEIAATAFYYPFAFFIQPYIGTSIIYNLNSARQEGNTNIIILDKIENNFSMEILFGLNLSPKDKINILAELGYSYNRPSYTSHPIDQDNLKTTDKLKLDAIYFKFGILVMLD